MAFNSLEAAHGVASRLRADVGSVQKSRGEMNSSTQVTSTSAAGVGGKEVTRRLPGRVGPATKTFASLNDLAKALQRAAAAHGEHEKRTERRDANWPDRGAAYATAEQAGKELPQ